MNEESYFKLYSVLVFRGCSVHSIYSLSGDVEKGVPLDEDLCEVCGELLEEHCYE